MAKYKYFGRLCKVADRDMLYFRNSKRRFEESWGKNSTEWALFHGFIRQSRQREDEYQAFYEFTNLGENLFRWYCYSLKDWIRFIKYKIKKA